MKYNKNLAGVQITDELINRASSASARLAHDTILASTVIVRTAPAGGGTLLSLTTDYTLGSEDARLTTEAGGTVNTTIAVVNGAFLNTALYVSYKTVGDYAEAEDINGIIASVTVSGNYTVGNEQTVNVTAATADITIPSGLPIGTRKTIRKLHATTTSSVNILRSGTDVFTSASLTTVPIFGNGSFWIIEKVSNTRWDLVGGSDYRETSGNTCLKNFNGVMQQTGSRSQTSNASGANLFGTTSGATYFRTATQSFIQSFINTNYSLVGTIKSNAVAWYVSFGALTVSGFNGVTSSGTDIAGAVEYTFDAVGRWY
jgi:hypothetical protein